MFDKYGRDIKYMRISVTELCNLRCKYCMPEEGVQKKNHNDMLTFEEIFMAAKAAASLGVEKIRITGGEPLVKRGIVDICRGIANIEGINQVCMTTNGSLLKEYGKALKDAGVKKINISLDTLRPDRYKEITRLGQLEDALSGIEAAEKLGFEKLKINVVLSKGFNDDEIEDFVDITREKDIDVRFIELMPIGESTGFNGGQFLDSEEVLRKVPSLRPLESQDGVARMYKLPGAKGKVGLIRTISCEFCESCDKIRLTADGNLKPCLHSNEEITLKGKSLEEMKKSMEKVIFNKPEKRDELGENSPSKTSRDMNQIGG